MPASDIAAASPRAWPHYTEPSFVDVDGQDRPPGYRTNAEFGARRPTDAPVPTATFGDGLVDVTTAHIPELREQIVEPWPLVST